MAISLSEQLESDIKEYLHKTFGTYFSSLDERFTADIKEDVINTSDFHHGSYNDDDISIAFQRVTLGIPKESRRSPAGRRHRIFLGSHIPLHRRYRRSAEPCCSAAPLPAPSVWFGDRRRWVRRKPEKNTFSGMRG